MQTGRNIGGQAVDGYKKLRSKNEEVVPDHRYCQLCLGNWCHVCVCGLFQVIQISGDLYVYELTSKCPL